MFSWYETTRSKCTGRTSTNLYLQYKWDIFNYENHRFNVKTAKPRVDDGAPLTYPHLYIRPKKLQLELERLSTIHRNNKFLLERLAKIQKEGAWIDNKNYHEIKSRNTWKRQQEMLELAYNNQTVLDRLLDVHTEYNRSKLEDEHLMSQKYKANILKFPRDWREINERMRRIQEDIRCQVISMRTGKGRKRKKPQWLKQKEAYEATRAERIAKESSEAAQQERILKEKNAIHTKEKKRGGKDKLKSSEKTRNAAPERKLPAERKKVEQEAIAKGKKRLTEQNKERVETTSDGAGKNNEDHSCNEKQITKKDGTLSQTDYSTVNEQVDEKIASSATEDRDYSSEDQEASVRGGTLSETDGLTVKESVSERSDSELSVTSDDTENDSNKGKNN